MLSIFAEFEREIIRERVKAGIANARALGKPHGRPQTAAIKKGEIKRLKHQLPATSTRNIPAEGGGTEPDKLAEAIEASYAFIEKMVV